MAGKKKIIKTKVNKTKQNKEKEEPRYHNVSIGQTVDASARENALDFITSDIKKGIGSFGKKEELIFVPSRLIGLNRASILGGWPMGTIGEAHGPNGAGKSVVGIELLQSFVEMGHIGIFCDAERAAADKQWIGGGLGLDLEKTQYFAPECIEDASERINKAITNFKLAKKRKKIDKNLLLFILVDSATKLVPDDMIKKGLRKNSMGMQARKFSEWLKTLTPLVGPSEKEKPSVCILFINQERKNINAKPWEPKYYSTCGEALQFDASVRTRVSFAGYVKEIQSGKEIKVGKKHRIIIEKNKVGYPDSVTYFYTSNGKGIMPMGIDFVREAIDESLIAGLMKCSNGKYSSEFLPKEMKEKALIQYLLENEDVRIEMVENIQTLIFEGEINSPTASGGSTVDEFEDDEDEDDEEE